MSSKETMESPNSSKKSPLLYRFFLKGYKNPMCGGQGKPGCKIGGDKYSREKEEERYKRRQRNPEVDPNTTSNADCIAPPSPFNSGFNDVFSSHILENEETEYSSSAESTTSVETPATPAVKSNYFQSSIQNQRAKESSETGTLQRQRASPVHPPPSPPRAFRDIQSFYANHEQLVRTVPTGGAQQSSTLSLPPAVASPALIEEPIYAEIVHKKRNSKAMDPVSATQDPNPSDADQGPVYENLDVIRQGIKKQVTSVPASGGLDEQEEQVDEGLPEPSVDDEDHLKREIDEESIIENKGAIKNYWETKMRENAASQFARSNFGGAGGPPTTTIIDKINEEIREDYIRNLELMNDEGLPRSSASDISDEAIDFDSFDLASSNGSSPFGKPLHASSPVLADSPTLIDSGHQSQESNHPLTESEHAESPIVPSEIQEVDSPARSIYSASPEPVFHDDPVKNESVEQEVKTPTTTPKTSTPVTNGISTYRGPFSTPPKSGGKIENSVTHFLQFNKTFKRSTSTLSEEEQKPVVKQAQESTLPPLKPSAKGDDISYRIATSRLKKEIEDNLRREQELKEEGRVKTLSVDTVSPPEQRIQIRPSVPAPKPPVEPVKAPEVIKEQTPEPKPVAAPKPEPPTAEEPVEPEVPAVAATPSFVEQEPPKRPVHSSLYTPRPFAQPQSRAQQQAPTLNFKLGKNFTSLERYIMYSSLTKLNYKNSSMPPVWNKSASQEVLNNNNAKFEAQEEEKDQDEPEKVRKYYIPAEKKIQEELQEMQEREAELKRTRGQWKSTPNLTSLDEEETTEQPTTQGHDDQAELKKEETPEPEPQPEVTMRQSPGRRNTEVRRRSALISQWEDMISKHNNS